MSTKTNFEKEKLEKEFEEVLNYISSVSDYPKIAEFKNKIEKIIQTQFPDAKCFLHGSNASKLSLKNSDVDLCVQVKNISWLEFSQVMINIFEYNKFKSIKNIEAKTNLIKFHDPFEKLDCDLAFDTNFCVKKAELINNYIKQHKIVKELILLVKYFAKKRNIHQSIEYYPNSLCYSMMCLYFLQMKRIIPVFNHKIQNNEVEYEFDVKHELKGDFLISDLFIEFFEFYAFKVDFEKYCVSVREGSLIFKQDTEISKTNTPKIFCVEDPMILKENCCRTVTNHTLRYLRSEFNRCQDLLKKGKSFEFVCKIGKVKNDREKWKVDK
eukprot:gene7004-11169_t